MLPQEGWDFDLIIKLIAKQGLRLRDRFCAWLRALIPLFLAGGRLWTTKNIKAVEARAALLARLFLILRCSSARLIDGLLGCRPMDRWAWLSCLIDWASLRCGGSIGRLSLRCWLLIFLTRSDWFRCRLWLLLE